MRVGIIGTGFAARLRAEAIQADGRAKLIAVSGRQAERAQQFAGEFGATPYTDWLEMLHASPLDLVFICTINRDHGQITRATLGAGIHGVVEYPLAFDLEEAQSLVSLAQERQRLLHVEHIELLSGVHQLLQREIPSLGEVFSVTYTTINATRPAPDRWTYEPDLFGFPLIGAVSRLHRLIDLFGPIRQVTCQLRYEGPDLPRRFHSCYCVATLGFESGLVGVVTYGKGESLWRSQRSLDVNGHLGALLIDGEQAVLLRPDGAQPMDVGSRRGLFQQDTQMVLEHLLNDHPLYVDADRMLHALAVAAAAQQSAHSGQTITLPS